MDGCGVVGSLGVEGAPDALCGVVLVGLPGFTGAVTGADLATEVTGVIEKARRAVAGPAAAAREGMRGSNERAAKRENMVAELC